MSNSIQNKKDQSVAFAEKSQKVILANSSDRCGNCTLVLLTFLITVLLCMAALPFIIQFQWGSYIPGYNIDWLDKLEKEMRKHSEQQVSQKFGELQMAWQTPIYRINIKNFGLDVAQFNSKIAVEILVHYHKLLDTYGDKLVKSGTEAIGANQVFYEWQMLKNGWNVIVQLDEIKRLTEIFQKCTDTYLSQIGIDKEFIKNRDRNIMAWATVHESGISHLPHTHPDELVSGVFYVKMPEKAGSILFDDPRGPLPPFDNRIVIRPQEGDIILFPSWLTHQVAPTQGNEERISIAFNIHGEWKTTTRVTNTVPVHPRS